MATEIGPIRADCGCGCGRFGKPNRWGHIRGCPCARCLSGSNRREGLKRQVKALNQIGVPTSTLRPGNEENVRGELRVEVKSGKQMQPIVTRYEQAKDQSDHGRAYGDNRPFVMLVVPERGPVLAICDAKLIRDLL